MGVGSCLMVAALASCHGGGGTAGSAGTDGVDVKAACAALVDLRASSAPLNAVDLANPGASRAALAKAIGAYSAALAAFERVAPVSLRPRAEAVRTAVVAHEFTRAATERAVIDAWAARHCTS